MNSYNTRQSLIPAMQSSHTPLKEESAALPRRSVVSPGALPVFQQLVESLADPVFVFDREWRYVFLNGEALKTIGGRGSEMAGSLIWETLPGAKSPEFQEQLHCVARDRVSIRSELYQKQADRWFENQILPLGDHIAVLSREITGAKRLALRLEDEDRKLRDILDSISEAFMAVSPDGTITYMNARALKNTGTTEKQVLGKPVLEVFPQYGGTVFETLARKALETQQPVRIQEIGPITGRWYETSIYPGPKGVSIFSRDTHEQRAAEQALRESEERLRLAVEAGALGIWDWDIRRDAITWSLRTYELHGLVPGEFEGKASAFLKLVHPEDRDRVKNEISAALSGAGPYNIDLRVVHPNGSVRWLTTSAKVINGPDGKPQRMIGASADITERKNADSELCKARNVLAEHASTLEREVSARTARLTQTIASLEGVAYTIAHDLRAPLRALNGFAQIMAEDYGAQLDATGRNYLETIANSAEKMDDLISDLLTYAKLSHSDLPVEWLNLDDALTSAVTDLRHEIAARQAEVRVATSVGSALVNKTVLAQVLTNLLSNAIKFVEPGVTPRIDIWTERSEGRVQLFVRDNGVGIRPEHQETIFGVFERLHDDSEYPGTGIGLAIVRKALERIGGSVKVKSALGQGSCFEIEFPESPADALRSGPTRENAGAAARP